MVVATILNLTTQLLMIPTMVRWSVIWDRHIGREGRREGGRRRREGRHSANSVHMTHKSLAYLL